MVETTLLWSVKRGNLKHTTGVTGHGAELNGVGITVACGPLDHDFKFSTWWFRE